MTQVRPMRLHSEAFTGMTGESRNTGQGQRIHSFFHQSRRASCRKASVRSLNDKREASAGSTPRGDPLFTDLPAQREGKTYHAPGGSKHSF